MLRRVASVCLLLGWCAFWLAITLQPCCKLSVAAPHAVAPGAVSPSAALDNHADAGHHTPDSSDICSDINIVAGAALATAVHSFGGKDSAHVYPASLILDGYARQAIYTIATNYPPLPPPRPLSFHQRTSRLLI